MLKGLYILSETAFKDIYGPAEQEEIAKLVDIYAPPQTAQSVKENPSVLKDADVIFSGWGGPKMDEDFLAHAPNLKAMFYGAGSVKGIVTDAFWDRGIIITSAYAANAIPVAEYTILYVAQCHFDSPHRRLIVQRMQSHGKVHGRGIKAVYQWRTAQMADYTRKNRNHGVKREVV